MFRQPLFPFLLAVLAPAMSVVTGQETGTWAWSSGSNTPAALRHDAWSSYSVTVCPGKNRAYFFGGTFGTSSAPTSAFLSDAISVYDLAAGSWQNVSAVLPSPCRDLAVVCVHDESAVLIFGADSISNSTESQRLATLTHTLVAEPIAGAAPQPTAHSDFLLPEGDQNVVWLFNPTTSSVPTWHKYDYVQRTWLSVNVLGIGPSYPTWGARPVRAQNDVVVFAGLGPQNEFGVFRFSLETASYLTTSALSGTPPVVRRLHAAMFHGPTNSLVLSHGLGGAGTVVPTSTWTLSLDAWDWTRLNSLEPLTTAGYVRFVPFLDAQDGRSKGLMFGGLISQGRSKANLDVLEYVPPAVSTGAESATGSDEEASYLGMPFFEFLLVTILLVLFLIVVFFICVIWLLVCCRKRRKVSVLDLSERRLGAIHSFQSNKSFTRVRAAKVSPQPRKGSQKRPVMTQASKGHHLPPLTPGSGSASPQLPTDYGDMPLSGLQTTSAASADYGPMDGSTPSATSDYGGIPRATNNVDYGGLPAGPVTIRNVSDDYGGLPSGTVPISVGPTIRDDYGEMPVTGNGTPVGLQVANPPLGSVSQPNTMDEYGEMPVSAAAPDAAPAIDVEGKLLRMASITDVLHEPDGYWDDN